MAPDGGVDMGGVRSALAFLFVVLSGTCVAIWAGWYNENLDFVGIAKYAKQFPLGPDKGPLAFTFGLLLLAWMTNPGKDDARVETRAEPPSKAPPAKGPPAKGPPPRRK